MTAITRRGANGAVFIAASLPAEPALSQPLAIALTAALDPVIGRGQWGQDDPGHRLPPRLLSPTQHQEAQRVAEAFDAMLGPVTPEIVFTWLGPVNFACRNPQGPDEFRMRCMAIAEMVGDLPAAAFTVETRRRLATGFFPSAEDVRRAVEPVADGWSRKRDALRGMRQVEPAASLAREVLQPHQIAEMSALAKATAAELRGGGATLSERPKVQARPLPPHHLAAMYRQQAAEGGPFAGAARARLAAMGESA